MPKDTKNNPLWPKEKTKAFVLTVETISQVNK